MIWSYLGQEGASKQGLQNESADVNTQEDATGSLATGSCAVSAPVAFAAMYFSECLRWVKHSGIHRAREHIRRSIKGIFNEKKMHHCDQAT